MQLFTLVAKKHMFGETINMKDMNISQEGIALIKKFEGCPVENNMAVSYRCAANVPTIGYGSTRYKGQQVVDGMYITMEEAESLLKHELIEFEGYIKKLVQVSINQNQFDALVAWCFNIGPSAAGSSSAIRYLNEEKYDEVPKRMRLWNKATVNGEKVVLAGLERRRLAESMLFEGNGDWHTV